MKNFPKIIACLSLSLLTVGAMAQVALPINMAAKHHARTFAPIAPYHYVYHSNRHSLTALTYFNLNYDSADAITNVDPTHYTYQGELMNAYYTYPADTIGDPANYNLINNITVAFDSLFDPYQLIDSSYVAIEAKGEVLVVDTIVVPIVQINHSGTNDTLEISLNQVYASPYTGYPSTTVIKDTLIIGQQLGLSSDNLINIVKWGVEEQLPLNAPKFSVTVTYKGSKTDSCWYLYGFASFSGMCEGGGPYVLANQTSWSAIDTNTTGAPVYENSFLLWGEYAAYGILPDVTGAGIFYDCNSDGIFDAGDGDYYEQNIYIWTLVHTAADITTGITNVASSGFSVGQNYPNPFNKETQITYSLTKSSDVTFSVYDMTGRVLVNNVYTNSAPGQHIINLSANSFNPGVYFYSFNVNGTKVTRKMVITE